MAVQLPPEVQGTAAAVLVYTFICLLCSIVLFAVAWVHQDKFSCERACTLVCLVLC